MKEEEKLVAVSTNSFSSKWFGSFKDSPTNFSPNFFIPLNFRMYLMCFVLFLNAIAVTGKVESEHVYFPRSGSDSLISILTNA